MPVAAPRLIVEVYQHLYYRGRRAIVIDPVRFTGEIGMQDTISSMRIYKGPGFRSNPNYKALFHEHANFQGRKLVLGPGFYPNIHDVVHDFADRISSINFGDPLVSTGPEWGSIPVIVEVFEHANFKGRKSVIMRDVAHTVEIGLHDRISSVRIHKGPNFPPTGCKIYFYEHINFEGAILPIEITPADARKEIPNLHILPQSFGDLISSVKIEGWASSGEFTTAEFQEEFSTTMLDPQWAWDDPNGGGSWSERQGYLVMNVQPGQDLWQGSNFDAPRVLRPLSGNFAIETRIPVTPQLKEHGGLIVWKDRQRLIRLEKTSGAHAFRGDVRFERHIGGAQNVMVGRSSALRNVRELYLRLERKNHVFSGYASGDGVTWVSVGHVNLGMADPVMVGLHALCPGNIPATLTRFDYFRIMRSPKESHLYMTAEQRQQQYRTPLTRPGQVSQTERMRALRQIFR